MSYKEIGEHLGRSSLACRLHLHNLRKHVGLTRSGAPSRGPPRYSYPQAGPSSIRYSDLAGFQPVQFTPPPPPTFAPPPQTRNRPLVPRLVLPSLATGEGSASAGPSSGYRPFGDRRYGPSSPSQPQPAEEQPSGRRDTRMSVASICNDEEPPAQN